MPTHLLRNPAMCSQPQHRIFGGGSHARGSPSPAVRWPLSSALSGSPEAKKLARMAICGLHEHLDMQSFKDMLLKQRSLRVGSIAGADKTETRG